MYCKITPELGLVRYWALPSLPLIYSCRLEVSLVAHKERRSSRRFMMKLPLTVRWMDNSVVGEVATESREVSSRALYFQLPKNLKSGSPVEIVMTLPHELTQAGPVRVRCLGRILRTDTTQQGDVGVAAAIERYEFLRNNESAA